MTYEGTVTKTAVIAIGTGMAAVPGYLFPSTTGMWVGSLAAFVLSMVIIFQKRSNPVLIAFYAVAQGYALGAITTYVETIFDAPGAGLQALTATLVTLFVVLALYRSGKVRYTSKMRRFLMISGIAYLVFCLVNLGYMIFGNSGTAFGLRSDVEIGPIGPIPAIPLGVLIGIFAVLVACVSLIADFDFIENAVKNGAPRSSSGRPRSASSSRSCGFTSSSFASSRSSSAVASHDGRTPKHHPGRRPVRVRLAG